MLPLDRIDSLAEGAAIEIALGRDPKQIIASVIHTAATEAVAGLIDRRGVASRALVQELDEARSKLLANHSDTDLHVPAVSTPVAVEYRDVGVRL